MEEKKKKKKKLDFEQSMIQYIAFKQVEWNENLALKSLLPQNYLLWFKLL